MRGARDTESAWRISRDGSRSSRFPDGRARGFTLVEVLIAASITALLSVALAHVLSLLLDLSRGVRARDELRRDAQLAVSLVRRDVSQARAIVGATAGSLVLVAASGDTVRYTLNSSSARTLVRRVGQGATLTVAADIDTAAFALRTVARPYTDERLTTVSSEQMVMKFEPGDWNEWVVRTSCRYDQQAERVIEDRKYCAEEFWPIETFTGLTRAAIRIRAREHFPAESDLLVRVYRAGATGAPGTLLAEAHILRTSIPWDYGWVEAAFTTIDASPILAGGHYWILWRSQWSGAGTYAGTLAYERLRNCSATDLPDNYMFLRLSDDAGASWDAAVHSREMFFRLYGTRPAGQLTKVTQTVSQRLGVDFRLALHRDQEREYRAGYVAMHSL